MNKALLSIIPGGILVVLVAVYFFSTSQKAQEQVAHSTPTIAPTSKPSEEPAVPLPTQEDIIKTFFNLISERRILEAIGMMSPTAVVDESSKQAWGVQFNAFQKIKVKSIEPADENFYKVVLDVEMKPEAANVQPMPYYGWGDGEFTRWVGLEKVDNLWKITGLATGP